MSTIDKKAMDYISQWLLAGRYDIFGHELVAIVGTGTEGNNLAATKAWVATYTEVHRPWGTQITGGLRDAFDRYLEDALWRFHYRIAEDAGSNAGRPLRPLTDKECRYLAEAIAYLLAGSVHRSALNSAVGLVLGATAYNEHSLHQWVRAQEELYAVYPAELTIKLAQRLQATLVMQEEV